MLVRHTHKGVLTMKKKTGRPKKDSQFTRMNLALTEPCVEMLDEIVRISGAASRSEAIRRLIFKEYAELKKPEAETVSTS